MSERRKLTRISHSQLQVSVRKRGLLASLTGAHPCEVIDFNRAGLALASTSSLAPATAVLLELELPEMGGVRLSGMVRHANPLDFDRYRIGIEFDPFVPGATHNTPESREVLLKIEDALTQTVGSIA